MRRALLLLLPHVVLLGLIPAVRRLPSATPAVPASVVEGIVRAHAALAEREAALWAVVEKAAADPALAKAAAAKPDAPDAPALRESAFHALARALRGYGSDEAGLVLLDDGGAVIAWEGRTFAVPRGFTTAESPVRRAQVLGGPTYVPLASGCRLGGGGSLVGFLTLEVEYPFHNRFLRPRRVLEEAVGLPGVEVRYAPRAAGATTEFPFVVGAEGAERAAAERARTEAESRRATWTAALLGLALAVLGAQIARSRAHPGVRAALGATAICAVRIAASLFGIPRALLPAHLTDPGAYASPFAAGLAEWLHEGPTWLEPLARRLEELGGSPADLLFSMLALAGAAALLSWGLAPPRNPRRRAACLLLLPAAAWVALRGIAALSASVVQDGTVSLFQSEEDLLQPVRVCLDLSVFLAAIVALGLVRFASSWAAWGTEGISPRVKVPLAALLLAAAAFAGSPLAGMSILSGAAVLLAGLGPVSGRKGVSWVLLPIVAALLAWPALEEAQTRDQRDLLEQRGKELANPPDEPLVAASLRDNLRTIAESDTLRRALEAAAANPKALAPDPHLALALWQESDLAERGEDCCIAVRCAKSPTPISEFEFGIPRDWLGEKPFDTEGAEGLLPPHDIPYRRKSVLGANGKPLGEVLLAILPRYRAAAPGGRASLLRVEPSAAKRIAGLVMLEFKDGRATTSPPSEAPVPPVLPADLLAEVQAGPALRTDTIGGTTWQTLYVSREGPRRLVYALALQVPSALGRFESFLRFFLAFALAGSVAGGLILCVRLVLRRGSLGALFGRLQVQLFAAFVLLGLVPIIALAIVHQRLRAEEARDEHDVALRRVLDVAARECEARLEELIGKEEKEHDPKEVVTPKRLEVQLQNHAADLANRAAHVVGLDAVVYVDGEYAGTSRPELFQTELLPTWMDAEAYREVFLLGREAHLVTRRVGDYELTIGHQRLGGGPPRRPYGVVAVPELSPSPGGPGPFDSTVTLVFGIYGLVVTMVWLGSAALSRRIAAPVEAMTNATRRAAAGDLSARVETRATGELAELIDSFHAMLEDLAKGRDALARAEREAAWRGMARQIAHEIKNPLTPLKLSAQHLARAYADGAPQFGKLLEEVVEIIVQQVDLLGRIASDFSYFAKLSERRPQETDLNELVRGVVALFSSTVEGKVETRLALDAGLPPLWVDPDEWRRALTNLVKNAIEAMAAGGVLTIETARGESALPSRGTGRKGGRVEQAVARPWVEVRIGDTGPGLPEEVREKLFHPYITTKPQGTGLGLAIVKKSVDDAGGEITLESLPGKGTTVRIRIPYGPGTPVVIPVAPQ